jgi:hypothetical protein
MHSLFCQLPNCNLFTQHVISLWRDTVGNINNLPEDLIHENSEQNMAENMEIKLTMFTSERYE